MTFSIYILVFILKIYMTGLILLSGNYTYEGEIKNKYPHGHGVFNYANGDKYIGMCKFGRLDGFGKYLYRTGSSYTGYFSYGKPNGIGTFEDEKNIYKGSWRNGKKHGIFTKTCKRNKTTFIQQWICNKLIKSHPIPYVPADMLQTIKKNPKKQKEMQRSPFKGEFKKCITCYENIPTASNTLCVHVIMCPNSWLP
jgi:hypothetical protein